MIYLVETKELIKRDGDDDVTAPFKVEIRFFGQLILLIFLMCMHDCGCVRQCYDSRGVMLLVQLYTRPTT